jgi:hypothetical protein
MEFQQDTVTQKIILEFIEDAQLTENDYLKIFVREREHQLRLRYCLERGPNG